MFKTSAQGSPEGSSSDSGSGTPGTGTPVTSPFSPGRMRRGSSVLRGATTRRRGSQNLMQNLMTGRRLVQYGSAVAPASASLLAMGSEKADLGRNGIPRFFLDPLGSVCSQYGVSLTIRAPNTHSQALAVQAGLGMYDGVVFKPPEKKTKTHKVESSAAAGGIMSVEGVPVTSTPSFLILMKIAGRAEVPEYHEYTDPETREKTRGFINRSKDGEHVWFHKIIPLISRSKGIAGAVLHRRPSVELRTSLYQKAVAPVAYAQAKKAKEDRGDTSEPTAAEIAEKTRQIHAQIFSPKELAWYTDQFPVTSLDELEDVQFEVYNIKGMNNENGEPLNPSFKPPGVPLRLDYEIKEHERKALRCVTISDFDVYSAAFPMELILEAIPAEKLLVHASIIEALKAIKISEINKGSRLHQIVTVDTLALGVLEAEKGMSIYDYIFAFEDHQENRFQKTGYTEIAKRATRLEANFFSLLNKTVKAKIDAMAKLDLVPAVFFNGCIQHGADSANPGEQANPVGKDGVVLIHPFADAYGSLVCNAAEYAKVCEHYKEFDYIHGFHPSWDHEVVRVIMDHHSPLVFSGRGAAHEIAPATARAGAASSVAAAALQAAVDSIKNQIILEILTTVPGSRNENELKALLWTVEKRALGGELVLSEVLEDFRRKKQVSPERTETFWIQYCKAIYAIHRAVQHGELHALGGEVVVQLLAIRARIDALNHKYYQLSDEAHKLETQLKAEPRNAELRERLKHCKEQGDSLNDEMDSGLGALEALFPDEIVEEIEVVLQGETPKGEVAAEEEAGFVTRRVPMLRLPPLVAIPMQSPGPQIVDVPGDGNCLYYTVVLGTLLPVRENAEEFARRAQLLFGNLDATQVGLIHEAIAGFAGTWGSIRLAELNALVQVFRERLVDFIRDHIDDYIANYQAELTPDAPGAEAPTEAETRALTQGYLERQRMNQTWGGGVEVQAMQDFLNLGINVLRINEAGDLGVHAPRREDFPEGMHIVFTGVPGAENHYQLYYVAPTPAVVAAAGVSVSAAEAKPHLVVPTSIAGEDTAVQHTGRRDEMLMGLPLKAKLVPLTHRPEVHADKEVAGITAAAPAASASEAGMGETSALRRTMQSTAQPLWRGDSIASLRRVPTRVGLHPSIVEESADGSLALMPKKLPVGVRLEPLHIAAGSTAALATSTTLSTAPSMARKNGVLPPLPGRPGVAVAFGRSALGSESVGLDGKPIQLPLTPAPRALGR